MGGKRKSNIILFIILIALFEFLFEWIFYVMTGFSGERFYRGLLYDLPFIILMSFVSLLIVHTSNKYFKYKEILYIRVLFELFVSFVFASLYSFSINYLVGCLFFDKPFYPTLPSIIILVLGNSFLILILELFFYNQRHLESQKHIAVIEKERIEYLYATLKIQVNPHFLFNSLNVLSSLIFEDPQRANIYTKKLSNIYRYFLSTNTRSSVLVGEEILFLQSYIYLLQIRFEDALTININGNSEIQKQIIPVSIQLLIENAIKHNVASVEHPLIVNVNISTENIMVVNNLQLRLNVEKSGHGLSNVQKQYALYNKKIEIVQTKDLFSVQIPYL